MKLASTAARRPLSECLVLVSLLSVVLTISSCAMPVRNKARAVSIRQSVVAKAGVAGRNRALAAAAAADAFSHFLVPPGAIRLNAAPRETPGLRRLGVYSGHVDTTLTRTGWWRVPLRYDQLVAWYAARTHADTHSTYYAGATSPAPAAEFTWPTRGRSRAYSTPVDVVEYARLGPHVTAIRTDVTLAARADRTAATLAPATVTRIDVTKRAIDGPDTTPKTTSVADQNRIIPVVNAFNRLLGNYVSNGPAGCGSPVGIVYTCAVTFHWPGHTLIVDAGAALCGIGRGLARDGKQLPQTLQDATALDNALKAAYRG